MSRIKHRTLVFIAHQVAREPVKHDSPFSAFPVQQANPPQPFSNFASRALARLGIGQIQCWADADIAFPAPSALGARPL
jgi:hypothetical protein